MELKEVLLKRRSVRKFSDQDVSREFIDELLHAAMSGPSACNATPWEFYVIKNQEVLQKLQGATQYAHINAHLAIIVVGNLSRALPMQLAPFWVQDCSAATENILLRAVDLGLGAVWCGIHPQKRAEKKVGDVLGLSPKQVPLNIIYIGYPAESPEMRDQYNEKYIHILE
ncbi:MAG: nitroreductase family protein [Lachnospiraceae bacterium]|nr:nitroreductase family protein [Lachnospiraceae bacterium]